MMAPAPAISRLLAVATLVCGLAAQALPAFARPAMGMFVAWAKDRSGADLGGREVNLRAWERRLGYRTSSLLALDYYGDRSWAAMHDLAWLPGYWRKANPDRKLVWSIPLTMTGTPLSEVAVGAHDGDFETAARAIATAQPDAVIRIGWEMNGDWTAWSAVGREAAFIAAYRRVAGIFRHASPAFRLDWCTNWGRSDGAPDMAWPGDDVVDLVGMDVYDTPGADWVRTVRSAPFGLDWLLAFSQAHGKPVAIDEWGVGLKGAADNPAFVSRMADWLRAHAGSVAHHVVFDVPPHQLETAFPASERRLIERFQANGPD